MYSMLSYLWLSGKSKPMEKEKVTFVVRILGKEQENRRQRTFMAGSFLCKNVRVDKFYYIWIKNFRGDINTNHGNCMTMCEGTFTNHKKIQHSKKILQ